MIATMLVIGFMNVILTAYGYLHGIYAVRPDEVKRIAERINRSVNKEGLVAVTKPEPEELAKRGTKLEEEEKEVERLFDRILPNRQ